MEALHIRPREGSPLHAALNRPLVCERGPTERVHVLAERYAALMRATHHTTPQADVRAMARELDKIGATLPAWNPRGLDESLAVLAELAGVPAPVVLSYAQALALVEDIEGAK